MPRYYEVGMLVNEMLFASQMAVSLRLMLAVVCQSRWLVSIFGTIHGPGVSGHSCEAQW